MAAWKTSSLAFSDGGLNKSTGSNSLKNPPTRISKQHVSEQRLFGGKRGKIGTDFKIGKMFRKSGKGIMKGSSSPKMMQSSGISPSLEEFDKMMSKVVGSKNSSKKSMFSRKQFG